MKPTTELAKSRQSTAAGMLALARKEIIATDMEALAKKANSASKKVHASLKATSTQPKG